MNRPVSVVTLSLLLSGCFNDLTEVQQYIAEVKADTRSYVEPLPAVMEFEHFSYRLEDVRNPFIASKSDAVQEKFSQKQNCLQPDPKRPKQPLEKYALDNLTMRGTLGYTGKIWALIEASDKTLHRVTLSNRAGLFHGRIVTVEPDYIQLLELIPDGDGCWKERITLLQMTAVSSVQGG